MMNSATLLLWPCRGARRHQLWRSCWTMLLAMLLLYSCRLDVPAENELTDPDAVTDLLSAYEALSSAYESYPTEHFTMSLLADDFAPLSYARMSPDLLPLYRWQPTALEEAADRLWQSYYQCVMHTNVAIERIEKLLQTPSPDTAGLSHCLAEALTLKSMCYQELIVLFAPRPTDAATDALGIVLKDGVEAAQLPRSTVQSCVAEVDALLERALTLFAAARGTTPLHGGDVAFCSERAAQLSYARWLMYQGHYPEAARWAQPICEEYARHSWPLSYGAVARGSGLLLAKHTQVPFYTEAFVSSRRLGEATVMLAPGAAPSSSTDLRYQHYVIDSIRPASATAQQQLLQLPGKYLQPLLAATPLITIPILRRGEAIYIYAEATARSGHEHEAQQTLNRYLSAVQGEPRVEPVRGDALLEWIMAEKRREMAGEGVRYADLKRLALERHQMGFDAAAYGVTIAADDYRWVLPIPKSEYRSNPHIKDQNPGWPPIPLRR